MPPGTTPSTGAGELLQQKELGTLIRPGSVDELATALHRFIQQPPDRSRVLAAAAPLASYYSWEAYGDRWAKILLET